MRKERRNLSGAFKAKVALEALQEKKTIAQLASEYELQPSQICAWKKQLLESSSKIFEQPKTVVDQNTEKEKDELYKQIGKLQVQNEWLKKKSEQYLGLKFS
jgi:transposase